MIRNLLLCGLALALSACSIDLSQFRLPSSDNSLESEVSLSHSQQLDVQTTEEKPLQERPRKLRLLQPGEAIDLSDMELTLLVGSPHFIWRDGKAEVWRYRQGECITDFYLYAASRGAMIAWMEQLNSSTQTPLSSPCLLVPEE